MTLFGYQTITRSSKEEKVFDSSRYSSSVAFGFFLVLTSEAVIGLSVIKIS